MVNIAVDGNAELLQEVAGSSAKTRIEAVLNSLRERILENDFKPGSRLRVEKLRQEFGVSASTIREALSRLMAESLVTAEGQRGFRVADVSFEDFRDIADMRKTLEIIAVRQSIELGDDEWEGNVVAAFHRLSKVEERLDEEDLAIVEEWTLRNQAFHDALIGGCGNRWLWRFRSILHGQSNRYIRIALAGKSIPRDVHAEHEAIFEATIARDADQVSSLLDKHIERTVKAVAKDLKFPLQPVSN
ncbi:MAG: GntR family transcriptional regulator [Magnetospiraceae bacterium]